MDWDEPRVTGLDWTNWTHGMGWTRLDWTGQDLAG